MLMLLMQADIDFNSHTHTHSHRHFTSKSERAKPGKTGSDCPSGNRAVVQAEDFRLSPFFSSFLFPAHLGFYGDITPCYLEAFVVGRWRGARFYWVVTRRLNKFCLISASASQSPGVVLSQHIDSVNTSCFHRASKSFLAKVFTPSPFHRECFTCLSAQTVQALL